MSAPLLVTGASGHLGRRVVELLLESHKGSLIVTTREPSKLSDLAARGVVVRKADFDDAKSLDTAFAGAERLLLISTDSLDVPGRRITQHQNALDAALRVGVRHIVYTSLTRPEPDSPITLAKDHWATEQALAKSGLSYTVLRNNIYADMLLNSLPQAIATGQLVAATGTGSTAFITREDCARIAVAALRSTFDGKRTMEVTGPSAVSHAELARLAGELSGRPVQFVPVDAASLKAGMVAHGLPAPLAEVYASFDVAVAEGRMGEATGSVAELTGKAPTSVASFLTSHRETLKAAGR
ncbi:SDR family oxidoreductase [Myxococcus llanfairpwllgwyngyllgogerychwyrndrobwllllantysiliogogogochensis]|uniref:SDR family oxidoreductase n=1 Tax=Myxococcus llanfairpwllgwyngyllgogerychwyrndrobwllllantysiliogogogochensis TaxID=2590453 RepID=A0A540WQ50_9BACT|nr:SDR family oxidoreductase [Myxococcus llanfairpwllgwyngyllgogerychwyrndrobwllllantysiliogogogochensis]TQF10554.1 SDR family oxidoreductase [Myxococcus llanfairpwllgwyngyllgogerychwyrndrobwllllantysiliogogogochensis]